MDENNKVSVKINKIWIFIGILVVITIVANVYVITNNKTQTSEDKNFETEEQTNAVRTRVENTQNIDSLSEVDAEKILKDKYTKFEKVYFNTDKFFKFAEEDTNGMRLILNLDEALDNDFSENMKTIIKNDCIIEENGKYYYYDGLHGDYPYAGFEKIDNIIETQNKITADVVFKFNNPDDVGGTQKRTVEIQIIKDGEKWLLDTLDSIYNLTDYQHEGSEPDNNEPKTYTYSSMNGMYKGTAKDNVDSNDDRNYELYLYEDGTFEYESYVDFDSGVTGNYIIVDDSIILNYLFTTGNDPAMGATEGQKLLKINEDGSITDSNPDMSDSKNLVLKKLSDNKEYKNGINYLIAYDNNYLYNKTNSDNDMSESPYFAKKVEIPESIYTKIKGTYKGTEKDKDNPEDDRNYELRLFKDGMFIYENYLSFDSGVIGNYTIVDDSINLNKLFTIGNDPSITATEGQKVLKINKDNSITDSNPDDSNSTNLVLKKSSDNYENGYDDVNELINNGYISNNASNEE